jgi:hypothetical protein
MNKIAEDVSEFEFEKFLDANDVLADAEDMDEKELKTFSQHKKRILRAIQSGALTIDENGVASYTPTHPDSPYTDAITFKQRTGATLLAADSRKDGQDAAKTYSMMASMTGLPPKVFSGLIGKDIKVPEAIFILLMN